MEIIRNDCFDPCFNLAAEEYLIMQGTTPVFMLWRNERSVIVGKNQNTVAEVNSDYCEKEGIKVVRRLTGGGAVFHDKGNVNYTVIEQNTGEKFNNYALFTRDIVEYLATLGVKATLSGRNDLLLDGKKIIGNAQCVKNGKIMHHGCILFSADMSKLAGALKVNAEKIRDKGIKSVSSRVVNIADTLKKPISVEDFLDGLESFLELKYNCKAREFSKAEREEISALAESKYRTFEWNYGTSPDFDYKNEKKFPFGLLSVSLAVEGGVIADIGIKGDFFGIADVVGLEDRLRGLRYRKPEIISVLEKTDIDLFIKGCTATDLIKILF